MTPERFRSLDALYDAAAAMSAEERARFIDAECAGDDELRRQLLEALGEDSSGLTGIVEEAAAALADAGDSWDGRRVGPYRIVRLLGRGGMGSVYLGVRDDDEYRKEVAVKTLKFETGDSAGLSRFRHERQILASLEHPHIARLLDGGTTAQGTPYIVLEYIAGVPITTYCEQRKLSIEERVRLFRQVCDAVQYAHRNLVVHRDIKPANILVTADGSPKLLDFGIAKLLDSGEDPLAEPQTATATGLRFMTPDYASPEQVLGEKISTATDIYSLGGVLYHLLTGERPHALRNYDPVEIGRVVCQTEVPQPSTRGGRRLRGDLDTIVLKAMQKEPARRYSSVEQLSEDVRRHLEGLPIAARPDAPLYRAAKFVRRNRVAVAAATAVALALAIGLAVSIHEARIARSRFAQVRELANTFLFQFYDQVSALPGSTAVRASVVETARKYLDGLAAEAGNDKGLVLELAQAYRRLGSVQGQTEGAGLGQLDQARKSYQHALELYARLPVNAASPPEWRRAVADVLYALSRIEINTRHEAVAESLARQVLDLLGEGGDGETRMLRDRGRRTLAEVRLKEGHTSEALTLMKTATEDLLELQGAHFPNPDLSNEVSQARLRLARMYVAVGDLDEALRIFEELLQASPKCEESAPPGSSCRSLGVRLSWTGDVYAAVDRPNLGEPAKAAVRYEQALHIQERLAALDPHDKQAQFDLAARLGKLGDAIWKSDPHRALALYERALKATRSLLSEEQVKILRVAYLQSISRPLIQLHRTVEARRALAELDRLREAEPPMTTYADLVDEADVGRLWPALLAAEGNRAEAKLRLKKLIADLERLRAGHTDDLKPIFYLSQCYRDLASIASGTERREALQRSAAAWHSWPATSFTSREEHKDLTAAAAP